MGPEVKAVRWARLRMALLFLAVLILQTTFGADLRLDGVAPDLMLLLAICAGLTGGPEAGAIGGFAAGLLADLSLVTTPLGLSAMSWCLIGWAAGVLRANVLREGWLIRPAIGFVATVCGVALFLLVGDLVGQAQLFAEGRSYLVRAVVVEGVWGAVLIIPMEWVYRRAARGSVGLEELIASAEANG